MPRLCVFYPGICLRTEEKHEQLRKKYGNNVAESGRDLTCRDYSSIFLQKLRKIMKILWQVNLHLDLDSKPVPSPYKNNRCL